MGQAPYCCRQFDIVNNKGDRSSTSLEKMRTPTAFKGSSMTTHQQAPVENKTLEQLCINTIRTLPLDGVQTASSGHPGTPMALAPLTYLLWTRHMHYNPKNPAWLNRDRFILSAGHASMLIYSMLYLAGYDLPLEQLKNFRQWG